MPDESACAISIAIESTDRAIPLDMAIAGPVRLFIDADPATRAALQDALFMRTLYTCVNAGREWFQLAALPFMPVGSLAGEALLAPNRQASHWQVTSGPSGCWPSTLHSPEKFDFFDIDLAPALARCPAGTRRLTLHVMLPALPGAAAGALRSLAPSMLRPGCTPVINLFSRSAEPLPSAAERTTYPLRAFQLAEAEARAAQRGCGGRCCMPSMRHMAVELPRFVVLRRIQADRYWQVRHAGTAGETEDTMSFVDSEQRPLALRGGTVSVQLTCTNGDAPASLPIGLPDGDLAGDGAVSHHPVRFLRRPSMPQPAADLDGLSPLSTEHGLPVLLDLLRRHAPADSAAVHRQLAGIVALDRRAVEDWVCFPQGAAYMQGTESRLTIDEAAFARCSVFVFAEVLVDLLASHAHEGSFARLVVLTLNGEELVRYCAKTDIALPF